MRSDLGWGELYIDLSIHTSEYGQRYTLYRRENAVVNWLREGLTRIRITSLIKLVLELTIFNTIH